MHNLEWVLGLGAKEEWLDIYRPEPEETNEYAEYPDSHTVGYLLFKTEGDHPHHIHEFLMGLVEENSDIIDYKTSTPIEALVRDGEGAVIGVVADGKRYRAKGGVIMCTGGFENDQKMLQDYTGVEGYPYAGQANTGDGHRICQKSARAFGTCTAAPRTGSRCATLKTRASFPPCIPSPPNSTASPWA